MSDWCPIPRRDRQTDYDFVDDNRWLKMTVEDLVKKATLKKDDPVVRLR